MTGNPDKATNPLNGARLSDWRASYIEAIAAELYDFSGSPLDTRERARHHLAEAFGAVAREGLHDKLKEAIYSTIRRAAHCLAGTNRRRVLP